MDAGVDRRQGFGWRIKLDLEAGGHPRTGYYFIRHDRRSGRPDRPLHQGAIFIVAPSALTLKSQARARRWRG